MCRLGGRSRGCGSGLRWLPSCHNNAIPVLMNSVWSTLWCGLGGGVKSTSDSIASIQQIQEMTVQASIETNDAKSGRHVDFEP